MVRSKPKREEEFESKWMMKNNLKKG